MIMTGAVEKKLIPENKETKAFGSSEKYRNGLFTH
jgi:hypothetical protein